MSPAEPHQTFRTPPLPSTSSGPYVPNLNISQICGRGLFQTVMQDYLDILYPLVPVVHRPTFQADLNRRREATDPVFFALVVSLMSAVISIVPRKFYEYQQSDPSFRFKTRKDMVEECHRVVLRSRDIDYHEVLTLEKWAIAYCQSLGFAHLMSMNRFKIANGEAVMILWTLKCHLASSYDGLDFIEAQLRKKAFWLEFSAMAYVCLLLWSILTNIWLRHFRLEDPSWISLYDRFAFDSATAEHLFPYEVDDEYITATTIGPQPSNKLALTVGLNILSRVFCGILPIVRDVSLPLATANNADDDQKDMIGTCECGNIIRPTSQKVVLYSLLQKQKSVMEDLPNEFTQWHKPSTADMARIPGVHGTVEASHYESMKANIHVTHLWIQSTLFERLVAVSKMEGQSVNEEVDMSGVWTLRESICRQLLSILYNISQTNLEPNGTSLVSLFSQFEGF